MAVLPGFQYDIFISYRHNDNRSGWVTDFVKALEEELAATIKEPVSIYFDVNPHDGLLETHNVDKSLESKLKCLIFIPIISQTYCDPKSFAWQHEFCAFNRTAKEDRFGSDVKLSNGNVASRILPIKIHDIDADDKTAIETEIKGVLRAIDFIFKASGVNRPLKSNDSKSENLNHTYYNDQINKVANAIKDIIHAITHAKEKEVQKDRIPVHREEVSDPVNKKRNYVTVLSIGAVIILALFLYFNVFTKKTATVLEASIAVLPFSNLSNDPEQEYFSDGITDQIITNLSHLKNVKVIARTSVMKYKDTQSSIPEIGEELNVNYVLEGSVQKSQNKLKINAQLIRVNDNFHEWAEIFNRDLTDIFQIQDDISQSIASALGKKLNPVVLDKDRPTNTEAYDYYLKAKHIAFTQYYFNRRDNISEAFNKAKLMYEKAIQLDSTFAPAYAGLADLYDEMRNHMGFEKFPNELNMLRLQFAQRAFELDPNSAFVNNVKAYIFFYNIRPVNWDSTHYYLKRAVELDSEDSYLNWCLGSFYRSVGLHEQALPFLEKAREKNPNDPKIYTELGWTFIQSGQKDNAAAAFENAMRLGGNTDYFLKWLIPSWYIQIGEYAKAEAFILADSVNRYEFQKMSIEAAKGNKKKVLAQENVPPFQLVLLGMHEQALKKLEESMKGDWNGYIALKSSPGWQPVRSNKEYPRLLEKARVIHEATERRFGFR